MSGSHVRAIRIRTQAHTDSSFKLGKWRRMMREYVMLERFLGISVTTESKMHYPHSLGIEQDLAARVDLKVLSFQYHPKGRYMCIKAHV